MLSFFKQNKIEVCFDCYQTLCIDLKATAKLPHIFLFENISYFIRETEVGIIN